MKRTKLDRKIPGIGRFVNRCPSAEEWRKWNALLTKLYETGRLELLRQLKSGRLTFRELLDMERRDQLHYASDNVVLARPLWEAVGLASDGTVSGAGWLAVAAKADASRVRYGTALRSLQRAGVLGPLAQIRDLATVDWVTLRHVTLAHLGPTGWNHIRRAVSAFLTAQLGGRLKGKYHPLRLEIMAACESEEEAERTPDLTVDRFWEVLAHVPEPLRPCYVAMAAGGLGPSEYLRAEAHHLMPLTRGLKVLGTKLGRQGENVVYFGSGTWEWVRRAVPSPVGYGILRATWQRACKAAGQPDDRLYDLRHCAAQWATDEGVSEARVGTMMRHKTASMTRRYTKSHDKRQTADALDHAMLGKAAGQ